MFIARHRPCPSLSSLCTVSFLIPRWNDTHPYSHLCVRSQTARRRCHLVLLQDLPACSRCRCHFLSRSFPSVKFTEQLNSSFSEAVQLGGRHAYVLNRSAPSGSWAGDQGDVGLARRAFRNEERAKSWNQIRSISPNIGRLRLEFGRHEADNGRLRPTSPKRATISTHIGQLRPKFARHRPRLARTRPKLLENGQLRHNMAQDWPTPARFCQTLT